MQAVYQPEREYPQVAMATWASPWEPEGRQSANTQWDTYARRPLRPRHGVHAWDPASWPAEGTLRPTPAHACPRARITRAPQGWGSSPGGLQACQPLRARLPALRPGQRPLPETGDRADVPPWQRSRFPFGSESLSQAHRSHPWDGTGGQEAGCHPCRAPAARAPGPGQPGGGAGAGGCAGGGCQGASGGVTEGPTG